MVSLLYRIPIFSDSGPKFVLTLKFRLMMSCSSDRLTNLETTKKISWNWVCLFILVYIECKKQHRSVKIFVKPSDEQITRNKSILDQSGSFEIGILELVFPNRWNYVMSRSGHEHRGMIFWFLWFLKNSITSWIWTNSKQRAEFRLSQRNPNQGLIQTSSLS